MNRISIDFLYSLRQVSFIFRDKLIMITEPVMPHDPYEAPRSREELNKEDQPSTARLILAITLSLIAGLATFFVSFFLYQNR